MEAIREWVLTLCVTAVVVTVIQMLSPSGSMDKMVKLVVRVFFLAMLALPLVTSFNIKEEIKIKGTAVADDYTQTFINNTGEMLEKALSKQLKQMIESELQEIEVYPKSVLVEVNCANQNTAQINAVTIELDSSYKIKDADIRYRVSKITTCTAEMLYLKGE